MSRLILFNKPYGVLSQFTDREQQRPTLAGYIAVPGVVAAGRLDRDSEGLLVLTDDGALQARISDPRHKQPKRYWAQVEGVPAAPALEQLRRGVVLSDGPCRPVEVTEILEPPGLWPREPPIRYRAAIPTTWLALTLCEGRNRQVRRMTAAVGLPTLRLIRWAIGPWKLDQLEPGQWRELPPEPRPETVRLASDRPSGRHSGLPSGLPSGRAKPGGAAATAAPRRRPQSGKRH